MVSFSLGCTDTLFEVPYSCHNGVQFILCYNFSKIALVVVLYPYPNLYPCPCILGFSLLFFLTHQNN